MNLPVNFWVVAVLLCVIFMLLWICLPLIAHGKNTNYVQLATDITVCLGCIPMGLYVVFLRYHLLKSKEYELTTVALYFAVNACAVALVAYWYKDLSFFAPLSMMVFCVYSTGGFGFVADFAVPFMAVTGIVGSFTRLLTSWTRYAYYVSRLLLFCECVCLLATLTPYMWNLPKAERYLWDAERMICFLLLPWFYTGYFQGQQATQIIDRSPAVLVDQVTYLGIADARKIHQAITSGITMPQLEDQQPTRESSSID